MLGGSHYLYSRNTPLYLLWVLPVLIASSCFVFAAESPEAPYAPVQGHIISKQPAAFDSAIHKAYVVDTLRDRVTVIDLQTHGARSIHVAKSPIAIAINHLTHRAYVVNHGSGTVSVVDGIIGREMASIPVDKLPYSIAVDQVTNQIFVSSVYSDDLKIIDGATNSVSSMKAISADSIEVNAGAGLLYLMGYESAEMTVIELASHTLTKIPMGAMHLWGMARDPVTSILYVTRIGSGDVVAYNEKLHTSRVFKTGSYPCAIAINSRTDRIYVVNYADQSVTVIDGKGNDRLATLQVGNHPQSIAVDETTNKVYVANVLDDSITMIDGATNQVTGSFHVGKNPFGVIVDQQTGAVITANEDEPSFTRFQMRAPNAEKTAGTSK